MLVGARLLVNNTVNYSPTIYRKVLYLHTYVHMLGKLSPNVITLMEDLPAVSGSSSLSSVVNEEHNRAAYTVLASTIVSLQHHFAKISTDLIAEKNFLYSVKG